MAKPASPKNSSWEGTPPIVRRLAFPQARFHPSWDTGLAWWLRTHSPRCFSVCRACSLGGMFTLFSPSLSIMKLRGKIISSKCNKLRDSWNHTWSSPHFHHMQQYENENFRLKNFFKLFSSLKVNVLNKAKANSMPSYGLWPISQNLGLSISTSVNEDQNPAAAPWTQTTGVSTRSKQNGYESDM